MRTEKSPIRTDGKRGVRGASGGPAMGESRQGGFQAFMEKQKANGRGGTDVGNSNQYEDGDGE